MSARPTLTDISRAKAGSVLKYPETGMRWVKRPDESWVPLDGKTVAPISNEDIAGSPGAEWDDE